MLSQTGFHGKEEEEGITNFTFYMNLKEFKVSSDWSQIASPSKDYSYKPSDVNDWLITIVCAAALFLKVHLSSCR